MDTIWDKIKELPIEQRNVFILHTIEGLSFKEIAAIEGVSINTLLARKRYAVLALRKRLNEINKMLKKIK